MNLPRQSAKPVLDRRRAGVLLHPTSLPGAGECGNLGAHAYRFVDLLHAAGITVWQVLPLGPTHADGSPYQCMSSHGGSRELISSELLAQWGWLTTTEGNPIESAQQGFNDHADDAARERYRRFCAEQTYWLDDYALYQTLRLTHGGRPWWDWPAPLRNRDATALAAAHDKHAVLVERLRFEQFLFREQWLALKHYANERGILMFGDMPIFVAHDSTEVWAQREYFAFDDNGRLESVAGVPPDYFSATGQRWGNPQYRWERMQADGFEWWLQRMRTHLVLFDLVRVDHFRGFEAYWEIPASADTAIDGRWVKAPGEALFKTLQLSFDPLPLVAEDLGIITAEVDALRTGFGLPGMKILQFAFGDKADNPYLPHNHEKNSVVYTGTHDNDTTLGWFAALSDAQRAHVNAYLGAADDNMPWPLIRAAFASVADLAMVPMQDLLELDGSHRMNLPGTTEGNWRWRFDWSQVQDGLAERVRGMVGMYGR